MYSMIIFCTGALTIIFKTLSNHILGFGVSSDLDGCRGALKREVFFFILSFVFLSELVIRQVQTNIF